MRFIVDESTGLAVAEYLRKVGYDALAVFEEMPEAFDEDILARAVTDGRIVVTNDKNFGELVFRSGHAHHGVILFRLQDASAARRVEAMAAVLAEYSDRLPGHFTVVTEQNVRIRPVTPPKADE
jgi:predicted nuclease of predicted toxin-antitoxin system